MAIKYKDFEKREQLRKDYMDKAAEAAKTQANAYTDEQIRNIPEPPAPDIPTALPQKYEAFKVQLVQDDLTWEEYHKPLWNGNIVLTTGTWDNPFVTDTIIDYPEVRKYSLLLTVGGVEKELKYVSSSTEYNTYACTENGTVVLNAAVQKMNVRNNYYNNTTTVYVYCPTGSALIGQSLTAARYGKKQYVYTLSAPDAILQHPSETENTRFLTMCQSIATKNAKIKLTITDNVIEANYINISNELVTTDENLAGISYRMIGIVADRKALAVGNSYEDDMPTCIKGILEVEYTDEKATKECVYDKIQGESYTFKIGDFNHEESSAFDYYFNGAALIPFDNAQIQASFTYRPVSGAEKSIQVKSMYGAMDGGQAQYLPFFDISELFGQAANTVMATITSNTAIENVDMGGRPVTTISLTSNIQNFTDANDEIMVGQILTLTPTSLPQKYYTINIGLSKPKWKTTETFDWINGKEADTITTYVASWRFPKASKGAEYSIKLSDGTTGLYTVTGQNQQFSISINVSKTTTDAQTAITARLDVYADGSARILCSGANKEYHYIYTTIIVNKTNFFELTNNAIKVNSEVRVILDGNSYTIAKSAGIQTSIVKTEGMLRFTAETTPTAYISGYLVVGETSVEGLAYIDAVLCPIPTSTSELTNDSGFIKASEENTFTATQTFNGTESQAGIKTNAIDNENGNRVVYFNGTKQMFGSDSIPTQVRSSAQRLYFERPVSGGTGTEVVEVANLADAVSGQITKLVELTWSTYDDEISFRFSDTSKNYALNNGNTIPFATAESTNSRLRLDIGKTYAIVYNGTTYTAVAQKNVLGTHTSSKLEFTIGDKTLVLMDMASVSSNVSADNLPKYKNKTAIAYFSDYSTPTQGTSFVLKTIPWAYTTVIPYDDNFTQTADITISAALRNLTDVDPLYIAPTVHLSSDGINIWVPVFNTVQYGLDDVTGQPKIAAFETKICPKKLLLILNSPTGSVVRLNGFSNRYRVGEGYGIILSTSSWSQSGTKYVGRVSGLFTNRFTDLEMIFESNEDSDRYYSANVRVKKSADWLTGTLTSDVTEFIADSMPEGQIRAHAYPIISY